MNKRLSEKICVYCDVDDECRCDRCEDRSTCKIKCYLRFKKPLREIYKQLMRFGDTTVEKCCVQKEREEKEKAEKEGIA